MYRHCKDDSWLTTEAKFQGTTVTELTAAQRYIIAVYFTVVTMTTTGYGEITPVNSYGFLTVIATILVGIIVFSYALSVLAATLVNHDAPKYDCIAIHISNKRMVY